MMIIVQYILSLTYLEVISHVIGCYYLVQLIKFMIFISWNLIKQNIPLNDILKKYSNDSEQNKQCWAVITGATDGIGLGFAQVLTKLGFDVCLISRNQQKLNKTIQNLRKYRTQKFTHRKFMTIQFDFTDSSDQDKFNQIIEKVNKLNVGILVNNVGTSEIKEYQKFQTQQIKKIININCTSMALMTSGLIRQMKDRKNKSAIINLSSFAGECPLPYVCLYSATKAMNTFFSQSLSIQYPQIDVLAVRPMFVQSPLSRKEKGFNVPDRRQCAWACLKQLRWQYETNGYILHRILGKFHQLFMPIFLNKLVSKKFTNAIMMEHYVLGK